MINARHGDVGAHSLKPIKAARRAREVLTEELQIDKWTRNADKDEEIEFRHPGEATWAGIPYPHDLKWNRHVSSRLDKPERVWRHGGQYSNPSDDYSVPNQTRQLYTSSIRP